MSDTPRVPITVSAVFTVRTTVDLWPMLQNIKPSPRAAFQQFKTPAKAFDAIIQRCADVIDIEIANHAVEQWDGDFEIHNGKEAAAALVDLGIICKPLTAIEEAALALGVELAPAPDQPDLFGGAI